MAVDDGVRSNVCMVVAVDGTSGGGSNGGGDASTGGGDRQPLLSVDGPGSAAAPPRPSTAPASARASGQTTPPRPSEGDGRGSGDGVRAGRSPSSPPSTEASPPPSSSPFPPPELPRLTLFDLTMIGIGGTLGAGIFVLAGVAARDAAGPGIVLSFVGAAAACFATGLAYAEMASRTVAAGRPAGGAYSFAAATLGQTPAFLVGWAMSVEFGVSSAAVARAWAAYVATVLPVPPWLVGGERGEGVSPLAAALILAIVAVTVGGMKEAAWLVNASALLYASVVVAVIAVGLPHVAATNYTPFLPFGFSGALTGAAVCFFAYIGFDEVATFADEAAAPARDVPRAILASLSIVSVLYVASSAVLVGMVPYRELDPTAAFAAAFRYVGAPRVGAAVAVMTALGMQNTALMGFAAQPRLLGAMADDGLLPTALTRRRPTTVGCGVVVATLAGAVATTGLTDTVSAAALLAFLATNAALLVTRDDAAASATAAAAAATATTVAAATAAAAAGIAVTASGGANGAPVASLAAITPVPSAAVQLSRGGPLPAAAAAANAVDRAAADAAAGATAVVEATASPLAIAVPTPPPPLRSPRRHSVGAIAAAAAVIAAPAVALATTVRWHPPRDTPDAGGVGAPPSDVVFRVPAVPAIPIAAIVLTVALLVRLGGGAAMAVGGWLALGLGLHLWLRRGSAFAGGGGVGYTPAPGDEAGDGGVSSSGGGGGGALDNWTSGGWGGVGTTAYALELRSESSGSSSGGERSPPWSPAPPVPELSPPPAPEVRPPPAPEVRPPPAPEVRPPRTSRGGP
ncbi:hypothetical protein MMPV_000295 [Pyropia vietnamensis]